MSDTSYLGRLARRARPNPPGLTPPRHAGAAPAPALEREPPSAGPERRGPPATRRTETAPQTVAPAATAPNRPAPTAPHPARKAVPDGAVPAPGTRPAQAQSRAPKPQRPPADFVFEAPRTQRPTARLGDVDTPPPAAEAPRGPHGPAPIRPDPFATALAAAVRWTSSESTPPPPAPPAPTGDREPAVARSARPEVPAPSARRAADPPAPHPVPPAPRATAAAHPDAPRPADAATRSERFADVHIGSIEVEVVSPRPEVREPASAAAAPDPAPVGVALTRKVTAHYGLRQR